jgi:alpha,alpha-trehalase
LDDNFFEAYSDVKTVEPSDFVEYPKFLKGIKDAELKGFASEVNKIWKTLVKTFDHNLTCSECYTSLINEYPFVVPGGRFNEYYYW